LKIIGDSEVVRSNQFTGTQVESAQSKMRARGSAVAH
jgi:hypothetical protein